VRHTELVTVCDCRQLYTTTHFVGCSQFLSFSAQKQLNVVSGWKPRISRSSWIRNENVDRAVPMKCLQYNTVHNRFHTNPRSIMTFTITNVTRSIYGHHLQTQTASINLYTLSHY